jgi:aryl-alcohol dehydrogenase-like predicted oxidoreductase
MMEYRRLGKTGWQVAAISLGCGTHVENWNDEEKRNFIQTVEHALEHGVNFFDTADSYNTEEWLGEALGTRRQDVYVATKVGKYASGTGHPLSFAVPEHVYLCCDASLHRLKTDYIDLYMCHLDNPANAEVFVEAFETLKSQGKIRHYGISTNLPDVVRAFNQTGACAACQMDYNMLYREPEAELLPYCQEAEIGTVVRRPLDKGILSGKLRLDMTFSDWVRKRWNEGSEREAYQRKLAQVEELRFLEGEGRTLVQAALQFILANPAISCTIPGASKPQRLDDYFQALGSSLTPEELQRIDAVSPSSRG